MHTIIKRLYKFEEMLVYVVTGTAQSHCGRPPTLCPLNMKLEGGEGQICLGLCSRAGPGTVWLQREQQAGPRAGILRARGWGCLTGRLGLIGKSLYRGGLGGIGEWGSV